MDPHPLPLPTRGRGSAGVREKCCFRAGPSDVARPDPRRPGPRPRTSWRWCARSTTSCASRAQGRGPRPRRPAAPARRHPGRDRRLRRGQPAHGDPVLRRPGLRRLPGVQAARCAQSLALGTPATHSVLLGSDPPEAVVEKIFDYTITSLDWARHHLDRPALGRAIAILEAGAPDRVLRLRRLGHRGARRPAEIPAVRRAVRSAARFCTSRSWSLR